MRLCALTFVIGTVCCLGSTQEADYKLSASANLVVLDVGVRDSVGRYISNLSQEDFRVEENGRPQTISAFHHNDEPVTVGLVIDDSGSMREKRLSVIKAALGFISVSNPKDEVFVTHFNDEVRRGLPKGVLFSSDRILLSASLYRNPPGGRTALYDAIVESLHQLNAGRYETKSLLLVSDGGDNASVSHLDNVIEALRESQATIYAVGIFAEDDPDRNPKLLRRLADVSGGEAFFPHETEGLSGICSEIAKDIRNRYVIAYVPRETSENRLRTIRVTTTSKRKYVVRARTSYRFPESVANPRGRQ